MEYIMNLINKMYFYYQVQHRNAMENIIRAKLKAKTKMEVEMEMKMEMEMEAKTVNN